MRRNRLMKTVFFLITAPWVLLWRELTERKRPPLTDDPGDLLCDCALGFAFWSSALACFLELCLLLLVGRILWGIFA